MATEEPPSVEIIRKTVLTTGASKTRIEVVVGEDTTTSMTKKPRRARVLVTTMTATAVKAALRIQSLDRETDLFSVSTKDPRENQASRRTLTVESDLRKSECQIDFVRPWQLSPIVYVLFIWRLEIDIDLTTNINTSRTVPTNI